MPRRVPVTAVAAFGAAALMLAWLLRPVLTGTIPSTGDLLHFNYPLREFYARALGAAWAFDWMPSLHGGFYVVGEGQLGAYHPLHWLLYRFVPVERAFGIEAAAPFPLLFAGTYLLLRRWVDVSASAFGAMSAASCGFMLAHGVHPNMTTVVAHAPWVLWAIHGLFGADGSGRRFGWTALLAGLTGSQLLLGHPQAVWWSGLLTASYAGLLATQVRGRAAATAAAHALVGILLGLGVGAVQVMATLDALRHSTRPLADPSFANSFALAPDQLGMLLHPYATWGRILRWNEVPGAGDEFAVYGGAVTLTLAAWWVARQLLPGAARSRPATTPLAVWAGLAAIAGVWLALGQAGGLYLLQSWMPVVGAFRAPVRYILFLQLGLAIVAAVALATVRDRDAARASRRALWGPWALVVLAVISAPWSGSGPLVTAAAGPVLLAAAASLLTLAVSGTNAALAGLVLLAAADQALYGLGGVAAWRDYLTRDQAVALLDSAEAGITPASGRLARGGFPDLYLLGGFELLDGYTGLTPVRTLSYRSGPALRVAGVAYAHDDFLQGTAIAGAERLPRGWYRLPAPLPRARLVAESVVSTNPAQDLERVDVERAALVARVLALDPGAPGTAAIVRDEPGRIAVSTAASGRRLLVLSEAFDEGWAAAVDGRPAAVERVNGDFLGCVVPAGTHEVEFVFRPRHLRRGKAISLVSGAVVVALAGLAFSRRRRGRTGMPLTVDG